MFLKGLLFISALLLSVSLSHSAPLNLDLNTFHDEALKRFKRYFANVPMNEKGIWLTEGYSAGVMNETTLAQVFEFPMSGLSNHVAVGFRFTGEWFIRFADFQSNTKTGALILQYRHSNTFTGKIKGSSTPAQIANVIRELKKLFPKADVVRNFFEGDLKMILVGDLEPQEWFQVYDFFTANPEIVESLFPAPPGRWTVPYSFLPSVYLGDGLSSGVIDLNRSLVLPEILRAQGTAFRAESILPQELQLGNCIGSLSADLRDKN